MTLWLLAVSATRWPAARSPTMNPRRRVRLAGPRWALDRQVGAVERARQAPRPGDRIVVGLLGQPHAAAEPGQPPSEELATGRHRTVIVQLVHQRGPGHIDDGVGRLGVERALGDHRRRVRCPGTGSPLESDLTGLEVEGHEAADLGRVGVLQQLAALGRRVDPTVCGLDLLVGVKAVGPDVGPLDRFGLADELQPGDRLAVVPQVVVVAPQDPVEVAPPLGLGLAGVPEEQLAQQPPSVVVGPRFGHLVTGVERPGKVEPLLVLLLPVRHLVGGPRAEPPDGEPRGRRRPTRRAGPPASPAAATSTRRRRGCTPRGSRERPVRRSATNARTRRSKTRHR